MEGGRGRGGEREEGGEEEKGMKVERIKEYSYVFMIHSTTKILQLNSPKDIT